MHEETPYLDALNPEQLEAATYTGKSLLILAGAGSGKTRVITTKIAWLILSGIARPHEILAVTFTNKAAAEMAERVRDIAPDSKGVMIRTFHSFCAYLLRRYASEARLDPHFTIYDDDDALQLLSACFESEKKRDLKVYSRLISRAKDYLLGPDDDLDEISEDPDFREYYRAYQMRLDAMGNCDFGDLIAKSVGLIRRNADVREALRRRFAHVLVDEYQDSNVAQFELLKAMVGPKTSVCVVGDDDQSIYRFRGAEVRNIINFSDEFPDTKIIKLERNYRSTAPILELAAAVVSRNSRRLGKKLWTDRNDGELPKLLFLDDQDAEAAFCAELLSDGRYGETAILYRTNAQSLAFETYFNRQGIPYRIVGSLRFYEREEVKDGIAFLSLFANPRDEIAFRRVVNKPARGIGQVTVGKIVDLALSSGVDLLSAAADFAETAGGRTKTGLRKFGSLVEELAGMLESVSLPEFVKSVIEESGLLSYHQEQDEVTGTSRQRNLEELVNASADFPAGREGLAQLLELIELDRSRFEEQDDREARVTLITMHNTKGLEFPRVVITGLEEGLFPGWQIDSEDDIEEERRIFYVSVTRAMDELYLTSCATRRLWGRITDFVPSRFLDEIPEGIVEVSGAGGVPDDIGGFEVGTSVYHDNYGYGIVVKSWYNGGELVVLVRFETGKTAQFLPEYTHLERMDFDV